MSAVTPYHLEVWLTVTGGMMGMSAECLGHVESVVWLNALDYPNVGRGARGFVFHRPGGTVVVREFAAVGDEVDRLAGLLCQLGFPGRRPNVFPVLDTSDVWHHLTLRVNYNDRQDAFSMGWHASGLEGEDVGALRDVVRSLLTAAGLNAGDREWRPLFGPGE